MLLQVNMMLLARTGFLSSLSLFALSLSWLTQLARRCSPVITAHSHNQSVASSLPSSPLTDRSKFHCLLTNDQSYPSSLLATAQSTFFLGPRSDTADLSPFALRIYYTDSLFWATSPCVFFYLHNHSRHRCCLSFVRSLPSSLVNVLSTAHNDEDIL